MVLCILALSHMAGREHPILVGVHLHPTLSQAGDTKVPRMLCEDAPKQTPQATLLKWLCYCFQHEDALKSGNFYVVESTQLGVCR